MERDLKFGFDGVIVNLSKDDVRQIDIYNHSGSVQFTVYGKSKEICDSVVRMINDKVYLDIRIQIQI